VGVTRISGGGNLRWLVALPLSEAVKARRPAKVPHFETLVPLLPSNGQDFAL
jgi:hypothetical protein